MSFGKTIRYAFNTQPVAALSMAIGVFSMILPIVVIPIRKDLGYPTYQYDGPMVPINDKHKYS